MANRYRAGIIGLGNVAHSHAFGYKESDRVDLVAVSDVLPEALKLFSDKWEVSNRYNNYEEMLDKEDLDIVSVCVWHKLHAPITVAACKWRPKVILVEKPMAVNLNECDDMLCAAQQNGVKIAVAKQGRFCSSWTEAKRLIAEGVIGKINLIVHEIQMGFENVGAHFLDYWRYAMGDPKPLWVMANVQRLTDRHERGIRVPESAMGIIGYSNDAIGVIMHELVQPHPPWSGGGGTLPYGYERTPIWPRTSVFQGSEGIMEVRHRPSNLRYMSSKTSGEWITKKWDEKWYEGQPHIEMVNELVDWIEGHTIHRNQAQNGRTTIMEITAIYESARLHQRVQLPLHTRVNPLDLMVESGHLSVQYPGRYDIRGLFKYGVNLKHYTKKE